MFFFTRLKALSTTIIKVTHLPPLGDTVSTEVSQEEPNAEKFDLKLDYHRTILKLKDQELGSDKLNLELKVGYNQNEKFTYTIAQLLTPPQNAKTNNR